MGARRFLAIETSTSTEAIATTAATTTAVTKDICGPFPAVFPLIYKLSVVLEVGRGGRVWRHDGLERTGLL